MDIVEELKMLETVHPVLLAVDQVNAWSVPSSYQYENVPVLPSDICVPHALNFISKKKAHVENFIVKNGLCIGAVSFKHNEGNKLNFYDAKNSIPLLIRVPNYSRVEFISAIHFYVDRRRIADEHSTQDLLALRTYCGSNPRILRVEGDSFLLPMYEDAFDENLLDARELKDSATETGEFTYDNRDKDFDIKSSASAE